MKAPLLSAPIAALIAISVVIFPASVAAIQGVGGWYIDEETCSLPAQRDFLEKYLTRARIAHINVATYFTHYQPTAEFQELAWHVVGGEDATVAVLTADTVFAGGYDFVQDDVPEIQGLASWKGPIPRAEAYTAPNGLVT